MQKQVQKNGAAANKICNLENLTISVSNPIFYHENKNFSKNVILENNFR